MPHTFDDAANELIEYVVLRIVHRRTKLGVSQEQLASAIGVSQSHLSKIEGGEQQPSAQTLFKLVAVLGLHLQLEAREPLVQFEEKQSGRPRRIED